jgi:hypothetical protein
MNIERKLNEKNGVQVNTTKIFKNYTTFDILDLEDVNNKLVDGLKTEDALLNIDGHNIRNWSQRYYLFTRDEKTCVCCGAKATFWAVQINDKNAKTPHLNLWGLDKNNNTLLFTKDHIHPKSLGGKDAMENYQIMCHKCNTKKGNGIAIQESKNPSKRTIMKKARAGFYLKFLKVGVEVTKRNFKKFKDGEKVATIIKVGVFHPITNHESCLLSNGDTIDNRGLAPKEEF